MAFQSLTSVLLLSFMGPIISLTVLLLRMYWKNFFWICFGLPCYVNFDVTFRLSHLSLTTYFHGNVENVVVIRFGLFIFSVYGLLPSNDMFQRVVIHWGFLVLFIRFLTRGIPLLSVSRRILVKAKHISSMSLFENTVCQLILCNSSLSLIISYN